MEKFVSLILNRGNDLDGFFWPIYYFVKEQLLNLHQLPLWNNLFLSGTPLLTDPQAPIFYPLNIIFLLLPISSAFIVSFCCHFFLGGLGMYLCSKGGFGFSKRTSLFLTFLYIFTPKFFGFLEAGHVGLINCIAWIPFALWATLKISQKPGLKHSLFLGISLALLYYSHFPTFLIIAFSTTILLLRKKTILPLVLAFAVTFGLTAISLLPQLEWQKYSTRYLLLINKDVYPKWNSIFEPIENIIISWRRGLTFLQQINSEKWLAIGIFPTTLAFLGFLKLKNRLKFYFLGGGIIILLIIFNNVSPVYFLLLKQNWFLLLRVATRFWILAILAILYLTGLAIEKSKSKLIFLIAALAIFESFFLGWVYLNKPISKESNLAPKEVFQFLSADKSLFRVFCLTRCLSQKEAAIYKIQLLDGYNTLQQKNFYQASWQLTGTYWNYYTLSIPPLGTFKEKLKPDIKALGEYNVKYLISPYPLTDKNLVLKTEIDNFFIYENRLLLPRANAPVVVYTPNYLKLDTTNFQKDQIILAEVFSPGWKAYLNGSKEALIQETPIALRAVDIGPETNFVEFKYNPDSFKIGKSITLITIFLPIIYGIYKKVSKK